MGTHIKLIGAKLGAAGEVLYTSEVLDLRHGQHYGFYAWIGCHWRNYAMIPPLPQVRRLSAEHKEILLNEYERTESTGYGIPLQALLDFDYDQTFEDRRACFNGNGAQTCEPGQGQVVTYRKYFGPRYFEDLQSWQEDGYVELWYAFQ
jgi:hypothetical protein